MTAPATLAVLDAGPGALIEDPGRPGHAHLGVPRAGALDQAALRAADLLVGNPPEAAVVECLLGGLTVRLDAPGRWIALAGAEAPLEVDGRARPWGQAVWAPAGAVVRIGRPRRGARVVLAVAGGFEPEPVLGSRSTDTLSGLGPAPLSPGQAIPLGDVVGAPASATLVPAPSGPATLRLHPGPHAERFPGDVLARLDGLCYVVGGASDRVGLRLDGPPVPRRPGELPSAGMPLGAVQVPPDGRPVVFLADHPTTGGYPVVGVVDPADLDRCAQLLPGDVVVLARA